MDTLLNLTGSVNGVPDRHCYALKESCSAIRPAAQVLKVPFKLCPVSLERILSDPRVSIAYPCIPSARGVCNP